MLWVLAGLALFILVCSLLSSNRTSTHEPTADGAPFQAASFCTSVLARGGELYLRVPGLPYGHPHLRGLAEFGRGLPEPLAVVIYGSSVRDDRGARDVDVAWIVPGESPIDFRHAPSEYSSDDGYGVITSRWNVFHVAPVGADELIRQIDAGQEWATTMVRDGVLLAGDDKAAGIAWPRAFRYRSPRVLEPAALASTVMRGDERLAT